MSELFVRQDFKSHAGLDLNWKIDCDALSNDDISCLAFMLHEILPPFYHVVGIPSGGIRIAQALQEYKTSANNPQARVLIVDDVFTTGTSMEKARVQWQAHHPYGAVLFARSPTPRWVTPLFRMYRTYKDDINANRTRSDVS